MAWILIAEDEPAIRRPLARFLRSEGHEVAEAENGSSAIASMEERIPDLVLTDVNMPDMDGIELLKAVHERDSELPVIVISGGGVLPKDLLLASAEALGAFASIAKPFKLEEVREVIEAALAARN